MNFNNPPSGNGQATVGWLVQSVQWLYRKYLGVASNGGGGGGTSGVLMFKVPIDYITGKPVTVFTPTSNFIATSLIAGEDSVVSNFDPQIIPIIQCGWDAGGGPGDFQQIVPNAPVTPQADSYVTPFVAGGVAPQLMIPAGKDLVVKVPTPASSGFDSFAGHIYVTGFYV